ncbi:hypothetical protein MUK42_07745 [Musa troglodytarum]|uniref:Uncharacterized protein n=1 Tax=Musa troglodytarum TaxID=320322 RepID=A0A9E7J9W2_9LILI|nr:hypothetical protein MUK42_07745 [Musa troglodytarum]
MVCACGPENASHSACSASCSDAAKTSMADCIPAQRMVTHHVVGSPPRTDTVRSRIPTSFSCHTRRTSVWNSGKVICGVSSSSSWRNASSVIPPSRLNTGGRHVGGDGALMGNCTVKGATVSCSAVGAARDGCAKIGEARGCVRVDPETVKEVKPEAPRRAEDVVASAPPSGSAGGPMSYEGAAAFKNVEVLRSPEKGVWRVRVAISSEQLAEILSEQANTEAMIERMRAYAANKAGATPKHPERRRAAGRMSHCEQVFPC